MFEQSIKSEQTRYGYLQVLKKFMLFMDVSNMEELQVDQKSIQKRVEDYTISGPL